MSHELTIILTEVEGNPVAEPFLKKFSHRIFEYKRWKKNFLRAQFGFEICVEIQTGITFDLLP